MKQHPTFPAMSNRQADQTGTLSGVAGREGASRSPPSPHTLLPPFPPLLMCPPCINLSSRITSLSIRKERIKYCTRLQSILQGPSVDFSRRYLTLLLQSLPVELCRKPISLHKEEMLWAFQATLKGNKIEGAVLYHPTSPSFYLLFFLSLSASPSPKHGQHLPCVLSLPSIKS